MEDEAQKPERPDTEQSLSDRDQASSDRDQALSTRDQETSAVGQAASDEGGEQGERMRATAASERDKTSEGRDEVAAERDETARRRDALADRRERPLNVVANAATSIRVKCVACGSQRTLAWTTYDSMHDGERVGCPTCGDVSEIVPTVEPDPSARVG